MGFSRKPLPTGLLQPMCSITLTRRRPTLPLARLPKPRPTWTVLPLLTSAVVTQTLCPSRSMRELRSPTLLLPVALTLVLTQRPFYLRGRQQACCELQDGGGSSW